MLDRTWLFAQLKEKIAASAALATNAATAAQDQAGAGAVDREQRQDARVARENNRLAAAHARRANKARADLETIARFEPQVIAGAHRRVAIGSIVDIEDDEGIGRTIFFAPVGAGTTLTGPGGDGLLTVVTPTSPLGRALRGRVVGDVADVTVDGEVREWEILDIA